MGNNVSGVNEMVTVHMEWSLNQHNQYCLQANMATRHPPNSVSFKISSDEWLNEYRMERNTTITNDCIFFYDIQLLPGTYQYKYIIDNEWSIDPSKPTIMDNSRPSLVNNYLVVEPPKIPADGQEKVLGIEHTSEVNPGTANQNIGDGISQQHSDIQNTKSCQQQEQNITLQEQNDASADRQLVGDQKATLNVHQNDGPIDNSQASIMRVREVLIRLASISPVLNLDEVAGALSVQQLTQEQVQIINEQLPYVQQFLKNQLQEKLKKFPYPVHPEGPTKPHPPSVCATQQGYDVPVNVATDLFTSQYPISPDDYWKDRPAELPREFLKTPLNEGITANSTTDHRSELPNLLPKPAPVVLNHAFTKSSKKRRHTTTAATMRYKTKYTTTIYYDLIGESIPSFPTMIDLVQRQELY